MRPARLFRYRGALSPFEALGNIAVMIAVTIALDEGLRRLPSFIPEAALQNVGAQLIMGASVAAAVAAVAGCVVFIFAFTRLFRGRGYPAPLLFGVISLFPATWLVLWMFSDSKRAEAVWAEEMRSRGAPQPSGKALAQAVLAERRARAAQSAETESPQSESAKPAKTRPGAPTPAAPQPAPPPDPSSERFKNSPIVTHSRKGRDMSRWR